jgi:hypothetical protein
MSRKLSLSVVAAACLVISAPALAGGPPLLCIPIDGVTPGNAELCTRRLDAALGGKIWRHGGRTELKMQQSAGQWHAVFHLEEDVALSDIDAALKGSVFSVPRDRLRLFGHVTLVIAPAGASEQLASDLTSLKHVRLEESTREEDHILATVDMPYPVTRARTEEDSLAWETFLRTDFSTRAAAGQDSTATRETLPGVNDFQKVLARHDAVVKDLRWNVEWACRPLGGVVVTAPQPEEPATVGAR